MGRKEHRVNQKWYTAIGTTENNMSILNVTRLDSGEILSSDDAAWVLGNTFMILTMQSGFGLLEAGFVSSKNVANIMVKNIVDVTMGGIVYWACGYALSFGRPSNLFIGMGDFFVGTKQIEEGSGSFYTRYIFQFSFSTAATTIVSGAVAERMKLSAYTIFSMLNVFIYCLPACWCWNQTGFLYKFGFFDFAGACVVHLTGGASAFVAAMILGSRLGRFSHKDDYAMSSPVTALTGTFMLWWAWLSFNCGSTFGVDGRLWKDAAHVAVSTLNGSIGGGIASMILSVIVFKGCYDISYLITGILAGLVSVTAGCAVISPHESIVVGAIGALISISCEKLLTIIKVDDPVGAAPVHFGAGLWSTIAVGLFAAGSDEADYILAPGMCGLFHGCGWKLLGVQSAGALILTVWSTTTTAIVFYFLQFTMGIRMPPNVMDEHGEDMRKHEIRRKWRTAVARSMPTNKISHLNADHKIFATDASNQALPPGTLNESSSNGAAENID